MLEDQQEDRAGKCRQKMEVLWEAEEGNALLREFFKPSWPISEEVFS